ncbi:hypothetical protein B0H16DRAFT_96434 [Mycena metata]|uniref:F-box domain-containing protein n=1 Tax=Mycena metata TaxID=1033252 RepID=A0AAD7IB91_9AGAR|nr:hypothetical protein B0H16DRAFT_96434 [Mycena metata]
MPIDELNVRALLARAEELIAEIEIKSRLEKELSNVKSELNAARDIVTRLPIELSSDIFVRCLPASHPIPTPYDTPMLFLSVCRSWRTRAISTTELWTSIQIEFPRAKNFERVLDLWLRSAGNRKTSISLRGPLGPAVGVVLQQHAHLIQTLETHFSTAKMLPQLTAPFPSLRTLTIAQNDRDFDRPDDFSRNPVPCVEILKAAPALLECNFDGTYFRGENEIHTPVTHLSLQILRLGWKRNENSAEILGYLTLPALQTLYIADFDIEPDIFFDFLRRSAPALRSLSISTDVGWEIMRECFQLLPGLTAVDLAFEEDFSFLEELRSPGFLPSLRHLTIRRLNPDRSCYETLISMLSTRRASRPSQIQSFQLFSWGSPRNRLDPDIVASLRQLVTDGLIIHVASGVFFFPGRCILIHFLHSSLIWML